MNTFRPQVESLEPRWTPDGPRPVGLDGLPLSVPAVVPSGSPVITIAVTVVVLVGDQVAAPPP